MGERGPTGRGQGHRRLKPVPPSVSPFPARREEPPDPPKGLLKVTLESWEAFWSSDISRAVESTDLPALARLFVYRDQIERAYRALRKGDAPLLVEGSTGQAALNPLMAYVRHCEVALFALERQFGLTPQARARLGFQVGRAVLTLEELNSAYLPGGEEAPEEQEDPRSDATPRKGKT